MQNEVPLLPEEEGPGPLDIPLAVALDAGLEDEGVGVEVVVRGDGAVLAAAARVLHHHRHRQGDAAEVLWRTQCMQGKLKPFAHARCVICALIVWCIVAQREANQEVGAVFFSSQIELKLSRG